MMVTAVLSVVAVREPDPVEYVDIEWPAGCHLCGL